MALTEVCMPDSLAVVLVAWLGLSVLWTGGWVGLWYWSRRERA